MIDEQSKAALFLWNSLMYYILYCEVARLQEIIFQQEMLLKKHAVNEAMSKHKLSGKKKPVRAFYCSCGRGSGMQLKLHGLNLSIDTLTLPPLIVSLDFSSKFRSWLFEESISQ